MFAKQVVSICCMIEKKCYFRFFPIFLRNEKNLLGKKVRGPGPPDPPRRRNPCSWLRIRYRKNRRFIAEKNFHFSFHSLFQSVNGNIQTSVSLKLLSCKRKYRRHRKARLITYIPMWILWKSNQKKIATNAIRSKFLIRDFEENKLWVGFGELLDLPGIFRHHTSWSFYIFFPKQLLFYKTELPVAPSKTRFLITLFYTTRFLLTLRFSILIYNAS